MESVDVYKRQAITGVPADLIVKAARMYAKGPGSFALTSQSLSHSRNGVNSARALLNIPAILGYVCLLYTSRCV